MVFSVLQTDPILRGLKQMPLEHLGLKVDITNRPDFKGIETQQVHPYQMSQGITNRPDFKGIETVLNRNPREHLNYKPTRF